MPARKRQHKGRLLAIGGGEREDPSAEILSHLVAIAGGDRASLLVCAPASREPAEVLAEYAERFTQLGTRQVWTEPLEDRHACESPELLERLEQASAVFFTGGDQFRLTSTVAGTAFGERLKERFSHEGLVVAGTSAGATAMSSTMIVSGPSFGSVRRSDVKVGVGLGYLPDTIIDSHFNERGRINRLLTVFAQNSQILGLGIDENTALDVRAGRPYGVIGSGAVTVLDGRISYSNVADAAEDEVLALSGVKIHVVPRGFMFDPEKRELVVPTAA